MYAISSNHLSHDLQVADALAWLRIEYPTAYCEIRRSFPETITFDGSWIDWELMGVDSEWSCWLTDAIEDTGLVTWEDGEPWAEYQWVLKP